jgi:hypothetical protein
VVGRDRLSFAVLPSPLTTAARTGADVLAVEIPFVSTDELGAIPDLLDALDLSSAHITGWDRRMTRDDRDERHPVLKQVLDELITDEITLTLVLDSVPQHVADRLNVVPADMIGLLASDPAGWRPYIDKMLINFGLRVPRWRIGSRPVRLDTDEQLAQLAGQLESIRSAFGRIIPDPKLFVPVEADRATTPGKLMPLTHLLVPSEVQPGALPAYLEPWLSDGRQLSVHLALISDPEFGAREQTLDLALRAMYAWRIGVPQITIDAPWRWVDSGDSRHLEPRSTFAMWRGLQRVLSGRTFAGELPLAEGVHCWLMENANGDDAIVAWSDRRASDPPYEARLLLAEEDVRLVDAFGNQRIVALESGAHTIPIGDMPVFIEGVDLALARFRAAFAVEEPFIPATHRVHERELVLRNSWNKTISGAIRLKETPGVQINPLHHEFYILPGEELRLPLIVLLDRGIVAGTKRIEADVRVLADREHTMFVHTLVDVGWQNVEMSATWRSVENAETGRQDLVITQFVTNRGDRIVNLESFLRAPGFGHNRRMLAALDPGVTIVSRFHLPDGVAHLAGRSVRLGLTERDGISQLNRIIRIPDLIGRSPATRQTSVPTGPSP